MTDSNVKYRDYAGRSSQEDDPLMELSRIIGFDEPVKDAASKEEADDFSFDLEQELIGGLEAELGSEVRVEPQTYRPAPATHLNWSVPRQLAGAEAFPSPSQPVASSPDVRSDAQSDDGDFDFSASLESELGLSLNEANVEPSGDFSLDDAFEPAAEDESQGYPLKFAPALDPEDYPGDHSAAQQDDGYDPAIYEPAYEQPAYEPVDEEAASPANYVSAPSLEEELEMLLVSDHEVSEPVQAFAPQYSAAQAEPVATRYPFYPSQTHAEPALFPDEQSFEPVLQAAADAEPTYSEEARGYESSPAEVAPNSWDGEEPQLDEDFFGGEDDGQYAEAEADDSLMSQPSAPPIYPAYGAQSGYRGGTAGSAPDVETITVSESKVDQTDMLDLPDVEYAGEPAANDGLSALESEFAEVFTSIEVEELAPQQEPQTSADHVFDDIVRDTYGTYGTEPSQVARAGYAAAAVGSYMAANASQAGSDAAYPASQAGARAAPSGTPNDYYNHWASAGESREDFDYDSQSTDDLDIPAQAYERQPAHGRRNLVLASVAGAALLIGGIGYYGLGSDGGVATPVIIQADNQPIKVQPQNPGGNVVPNQDKAVYDRVAGTAPQAPEQKTLVSDDEKPVDIAMAEDDDGSMDDTAVNDRVEPTTLDSIVANGAQANVLAPRRVQTMIVRPDGTIVAQEAAPAAPASAHVATPEPRPDETETAALDNAPALPALGGAADAAEPTQTSALPTRETPEPAANAPARVVKTQTFTPDNTAKPKNVPVVPSRPAEQPVTIVSSTTRAPAENTQVASAANTAAAAAASAGGYAIQIASQPSAEAAQQSYANLARRYANVIGGHGVDIRRADIAGKGTYYRVRINAGSKSDAVNLCTKYKSAGGSCFVTQ
ncbi:SPOR domain-containing protein [Phyllobacterium salinisoli]|uniref:SPOR domain-containing protein n=1 Tax=Phyllobacterium salinisoli TaxID=1899321 RepID=A0A368K4X7_9HYPH|nr:SPOR domain-containing protein [Phyllobacterium salinisoli]RCS24234.1 SPOR domain-containing protein [Phyllobacterium salinisoli]